MKNTSADFHCLVEIAGVFLIFQTKSRICQKKPKQNCTMGIDYFVEIC